MDAFEQVVAEILWREGYWVHTSVKVALTREEKQAIGRPSAPRWELDVVAYSALNNSIKVVECKSFFDSPGVRRRNFEVADRDAGRFKLFNDEVLRTVVLNRLGLQLVASGGCLPNPQIQMCLASGRVASAEDRALLRQLFAERGWEFWDEFWLRNKLQLMAAAGYENQTSAVVAKLLLRDIH